MKEDIYRNFPVTEDEYEELEERFGRLCHKQAWELFKKNSRNNHTDEQSDIVQEIRMAMLTAGSYFKRQTYLEACFTACSKHISDPFTMSVLQNLKQLWKNRKRHGAARQKFGPHQEQLLEKLTRKYVPVEEQPNKAARLVFDTSFNVYCKSITCNRQKALGKKITREKPLRTGLVSISEYDYMGSTKSKDLW